MNVSLQTNFCHRRTNAKSSMCVHIGGNRLSKLGSNLCHLRSASILESQSYNMLNYAIGLLQDINTIKFCVKNPSLAHRAEDKGRK